MKALMSLLLLMIVIQGSSQRKKNKVDPKDAQIDTLTKTNEMLTKQLDSVTKEKDMYYGLYEVIKEKVMLKDFDPARFDVIVDSVRNTRDSAHSLALAPMETLRDSLSKAASENKELKQRLDSLSVATADKTKLMAELKDLKSLLDNKIISQAEYDEKKKNVMAKWQ